MRYRIKVVTFKNGRKEYFPQVRKAFVWLHLNFNGNTTLVDFSYDTREKALQVIDKNFEGNTKVQKIEIEYIQK
jgi:hypothetical protein